MGSQPRVSVLITTYQHERYIAQALDGVLEQSPEVAFELLVGDDASTDRTRAIISEYAKAHPHQVKTYFPERNLGLAGKAIFSELISRSRGEYIAMLDGDDYWTSPDKLRRQVAFLDEHPECSMCFHDVLCHYEDGSRPDTRFDGRDQAAEVDLHQLLARCPVASCSPLVRRQAIDPLPEWYFELPWGDWPLYFLAADHGSIRYLPAVMGTYRIHRDGMYRGLSRLQELEHRTRFYERLRVPPTHALARRERLAQTWVKRALEHERLAQRTAARACLRRSFQILRLNPRRLRRDPEERWRLAVWLLLRMPTALTYHPRWVDWRRRRHEAEASEAR